jgi:ubiquinone/menaquinone biosynthesis C-methylase UbiE
MTTRTEAVSNPRRHYLPAAGHDWFLPLYDPFVKLLGGERVRRALLEQAALRSGQAVLDIGCGTGTSVVLLKQSHPDVRVVGLDPDPKALARAARKADRLSLSVELHQGFADRLPYPEASFDRVLSSFMFHHLPAEEKEPTLREVRRVLRPGGSFHMVDFGGPGEGHGFLMKLFHSSASLADNAQAHILDLMTRAGFAQARDAGHRSMLVGRVNYYEAVTPAR